MVGTLYFKDLISTIEKYDELKLTSEIIIEKSKMILLEKYAIDNNTDLILDSTSYLIASNSLDITNIIKNELSIKKLKLEYTNFEKN